MTGRGDAFREQIRSLARSRPANRDLHPTGSAAGNVYWDEELGMAGLDFSDPDAERARKKAEAIHAAQDRTSERREAGLPATPLEPAPLDAPNGPTRPPLRVVPAPPPLVEGPNPWITRGLALAGRVAALGIVLLPGTAHAPTMEGGPLAPYTNDELNERQCKGGGVCANNPPATPPPAPQPAAPTSSPPPAPPNTNAPATPAPATPSQPNSTPTTEPSSPAPSAPASEPASNPKQDKRLSKGEIKTLKEAGIDPHELKPKKMGSRYDLFKTPNGDIVVKPADGSGDGDPTGINIKEIMAEED